MVPTAIKLVPLHRSARVGAKVHAMMSAPEGAKAALGVACRCHRIGRERVDLGLVRKAAKVRFSKVLWLAR